MNKPWPIYKCRSNSEREAIFRELFKRGFVRRGSDSSVDDVWASIKNRAGWVYITAYMVNNRYIGFYDDDYPLHRETLLGLTNSPAHFFSSIDSNPAFKS